MRTIPRSITSGVAALAVAGAIMAGPANTGIAQADTGSTPTTAGHSGSNCHHVPRLAKAWVAGWESKDPQRLAALFTSDAVYTDHAVGKVSRGTAGVAAWQAGTHQLIPTVHATLVDAFRSGDRMLIQTIYAGQIQGAPHPFAVPMATVLHLRGNRIVTDDDYYNLADLLQQSGLPPTWTPPKS